MPVIPVICHYPMKISECINFVVIWPLKYDGKNISLETDEKLIYELARPFFESPEFYYPRQQYSAESKH